MTHPTASNSREAISGSMINGASIGLISFCQGVRFRVRLVAVTRHRGPSLLAPSISPAKNVGISLHVFLQEGRWKPSRNMN
jgi:hypothetical protein